MGGQNRRGHTVGIHAVSVFSIKRQKLFLPCLPVGDIVLPCPFKAVLQAFRCRCCGFEFGLPEADGKGCLLAIAGEIQFSSKRDVAVIGTLILVCKSPVLFQLPPTVRYTDKAGALCAPWMSQISAR